PDALMHLCDMGRGLGERVVICSLGLDSMIKAYDENTTHDILAQLQNIALFRIKSPRTADYASQLLGEYKAFRTQISTQTGPDGKETRGESEVLEVRKAFLPSAFQTLPVASEYDGFSGVYVSEVGLDVRTSRPRLRLAGSI